jgi:hypothetical protein
VSPCIFFFPSTTKFSTSTANPPSLVCGDRPIDRAVLLYTSTKFSRGIGVPVFEKFSPSLSLERERESERYGRTRGTQVPVRYSCTFLYGRTCSTGTGIRSRDYILNLGDIYMYSCTKFSTSTLAMRLAGGTIRSLNHPWSSPKNFWFRRCRRSFLDQNLLTSMMTNPVSDLTGDQ